MSAPAKTSMFRQKILLGMSPKEYIRSLIKPINFIYAAILAVGLTVLALRVFKGLGATTNLDDEDPWGLWLAFDMFFGVAVATGGFCMVVAVYIFNRKDYKTMVRPALVTGLLGYAFAIFGLAVDLGRYWALPLPFYYLGTASVLFLVAEHLALYLTIQFFEFLPAVFEWLNWRKLWKYLGMVHIALIILGSVLVMGHQSALGAMFILVDQRLHPLWQTNLLPWLFFVSCIAGGLAMLVIESMLSHRIFGEQVAEHDHETQNRLIVGIGKALACVTFAYFALMILSMIREGQWDAFFHTKWGYWKQFEIFFACLLPMIIFTAAVRRNSGNLVRAGAIITVLGVLLNRMNVVIIALNYTAETPYYPHWMEYTISVTIVVLILVFFRFIVNRMPILYSLPEFPDEH